MIVLIGNSELTHPVDKSIIESADTVVRFNAACDPVIINRYVDVFTDRIDIAALNGFSYGVAHRLHERLTCKVLFTRPVVVSESYRGPVPVLPRFTAKIKDYTDIPEECFKLFIDKYNYRNPTSGLITAFYFKEFLGKDIACVNFNFNPTFHHYFDTVREPAGHAVDRESDILQTILAYKPKS